MASSSLLLGFRYGFEDKRLDTGHFFPNGRPTDVIEAPRTGNINHPTEKPVMLMWAMLRWSIGRVCDPFMGAGATGVAAVQSGRPFVGIELKESYFDIACRRIEQELRQPGLFITTGREEDQAKQEAFI